MCFDRPIDWSTFHNIFTCYDVTFTVDLIFRSCPLSMCLKWLASVKLYRTASARTWVHTYLRQVAAQRCRLLLLTMMMMMMMMMMRWRSGRDQCCRRIAAQLATDWASHPTSVVPWPVPPAHRRASRRPCLPGTATAATAAAQWRCKTSPRSHHAADAPATTSSTNSAPRRPTSTRTSTKLTSYVVALLVRRVASENITSLKTIILSLPRWNDHCPTAATFYKYLYLKLLHYTVRYGLLQDMTFSVISFTSSLS